MSAVHIRNVSESTLAALRERADRHGRSMQQELREILDAAARESPPGEAPGPIELVTTTTSGADSWRREDVYDDDGR